MFHCRHDQSLGQLLRVKQLKWQALYYCSLHQNSIKLVTRAVCPVKVVQDFGHVGSETPGKIGPKINRKDKKFGLRKDIIKKKRIKILTKLWALWAYFFLDNSKGQLISKCLFDVSNFSQKMNEKIRLYCYDTSGRLVFVRILGEIKDTKKTFRN